MSEVVIDTNVLMVANQKHDGVSVECIAACVQRLQWTQKHAIVVVDDGYRILSEYSKNLRPTRGKGVGDIFLKWLLQQKANQKHVHQVQITDRGVNQFREFPDESLELEFDPPDRKFVAVACAHPAKPPVLQASDCKWLEWWQPLAAAGLQVEFLCRADICRFYEAKFPEKSSPTLPTL